MTRHHSLLLAASLLLVSCVPSLAAPARIIYRSPALQQPANQVLNSNQIFDSNQVQLNNLAPLPDSSTTSQTLQLPAVTQDTAVTPVAGPAVLDGNESTFQQTVLRSPEPVVVEFYATWCPHCQKMQPVLQSFAEQNQGAARVVRFDVDQNPQLVSRYHVGPVPSFFIFKNGNVVDKFVGETDASRLSAEIGRASM